MRERGTGMSVRSFVVGTILSGLTTIAASTAITAISTMAAEPASARVRIGDDAGGRIGHYIDTFSAMRNSGEHVAIDGACLSACTLILGIVPQDRICVTRRAKLGFHAAWIPGPRGETIRSAAGTRALWDYYPPHVRRWINSRGGLQNRMIFLRGRELTSMYQPCR